MEIEGQEDNVGSNQNNAQELSPPLAHSDSIMSLRRWEVENEVQTLTPSASDELFKINTERQSDLMSRKPWASDVNYFKHVRISALAAMKMVIHAREGGNIEVMGMLLGKFDFNSFIILDAVPLPVEGTETRVNAQAEAYEFMAQHMQYLAELGRKEQMVGWYHSHPGYGCWLSGIDVQTQAMHQNYEDPFLAIVVDPLRTISNGKVTLGAFRTYPENYRAGISSGGAVNDAGPGNDGAETATPGTTGTSGPSGTGTASASNGTGAVSGSSLSTEYQVIPADKVADFGIYSKHYYALDVSYFKSELDHYLIQVLWNRYWCQTLSSSGVLAQADYLNKETRDLADKLEGAERGLGRFSYLATVNTYEELTNCARDAKKMGLEQAQSLMGQLFKNFLFRNAP